MDALLFAFRYYTNFPLPRESKWDEKTAAASLSWLPLTGLAVGLCLAALAVFYQNTDFPRYPALKALLIMAMEMWVGGALFVDGFSKTCDGVFSGLGPKRSLELMQGGSLGVKGALSLAFAFAAKLCLLAELSLHGDLLFLALFYPCWGRWAVSFAISYYPVAAEEGMAYFFKVGQKQTYIILSSVFMLMVLLLMPGYFYLAALVSLFVVFFCCNLIQARFGGQSLDTYGLAAVTAELSFLLFAAVSGEVFRMIGA
ncbi:MAG: adenosylcobinamide-GDP ribazoletransferase [Clostridiales bacterium]|nr:adenosylcobinamide-GDP ribazoletransferase [Clostridiales bacterium]